MKTILVITLTILGGFPVFGQTTLDSLETQAIYQQKIRSKNIFSDQRETVFAAFDSTIQQIFAHPDVCDYPFDSLRQFISVVSSDDGKLRIFSWDNLGGGTYHTYTTYLEYHSEDGACKAWEIDIEPKRYVDTIPIPVEVGFYRVAEVREGEKQYYLLFGAGTYGGGKKHAAIKVYTEENGMLVPCTSCYEGKSPLVIHSNRGQDCELMYDDKTRELSFKAFEFDDDIGFFTSTFEWVKYRFVDGKLRKVVD